MSIFTGAGTAIVTPFSDGAVDYPALSRLIERQLEAGTDAIVVCGTTGEASTLTGAEKRDVTAFAVKAVAGRVPVIAGSGGNNTAAVIEASLAAQDAGADALLIVTPYYNKTTQRGLIAHYAAVAERVSIPIIVYNVPSRTGLNVAPATMRELLKLPNIVGIKEASGNIEQIVGVAALCPDCDLYAGNDDHVVPMLAVGAKGVISTIGNIVPQEMHDMCAAFFAGDIEKAKQIQFELLPLWRAAFCEVNPIPTKAMMEMLGLCGGELRLPLVSAAQENMERFAQVLKDLGLL
ncbi:MAG: 4-hydroxy-tetrahydrodipicolinate synthase [Clostridiales bacterium]|nr:4-hydroxy-tetrahydrodipicolinate synthase [Clostridiales bacterium]